MDMNVTGRTFFHIRPSNESRVVNFMDTTFCLDDLLYIAEPVVARPRVLYTFDICLQRLDTKTTITFSFDRRHDSVAAQRELSRAWARAEEFAGNVGTGESAVS